VLRQALKKRRMQKRLLSAARALRRLLPV
jgi:hypothetical protein